MDRNISAINLRSIRIIGANEEDAENHETAFVVLIIIIIIINFHVHRSNTEKMLDLSVFH